MQSKTWKPHFANYLKRLKNLEKFLLTFDMQFVKAENPYEWYLDTMKVLPSLKRLREVYITGDNGASSRNVERQLDDIVKEFRNTREIQINYFHNYNFSQPKYFLLRDAIKQVNERQSMRCDLMF